MGSGALTVTDVVADEFCPLFTYFGHVLGLPQNAERRGTVQAGHAHHGRHEGSNRRFVPSALASPQARGDTPDVASHAPAVLRVP